MVLCREQLEEDYGAGVWHLDFAGLVAFRDELEKGKLKHCMAIELPKMKLRDQLFRRFSDFVEKELLEKDEQKIEVLLEENIERWGLWLKNFIEGFFKTFLF